MKFQATRERVVKTCIDLADRGYLAATGGNVALRADEKHFAVTPSATDYYAMSAADVCVLRLSDQEQVEGEREASVESGLHAGILLARPDCGASIHTHQPVASAYTLLATPLEVREGAQQALLGRSVPCVGYAPSGTGLLAMRVARAVKTDTHAYLMRNHGAVCVGNDPSEAMTRVAALESECASFFLARMEARSGTLDGSVRALVMQALQPILGHALPRCEDLAKPTSKKAPWPQNIIELLRDDAARLRAKALFGDPGDSLSLRIPGREEFVFASPEHSDPKAFPLQTTGPEAAGLHAMIYRARSDAGGILIGQTPWSTALADIGATIPTLFDEQARHIGSAGTPIAAGREARLVGSLRSGTNVAIYGNQRICIGTTPNRVVLNAELFEKCAKAFVVAEASGDRIRKLPGWVRHIARGRLRKDRKRAAESYAAGRIPEGMDAYF